MINFVCRNCGRQVEVDDCAAGGKGRCPLCGGISPVPPHWRNSNGNNNGQAAADTSPETFSSDDERQDVFVATLPDQSGLASDEFDLALAASSNPSLDKTDILPALDYDPPGGQARRSRHSRFSIDLRRADRRHRRLILIAKIGLILVFALAAIIFMLAVGLLKVG